MREEGRELESRGEAIEPRGYYRGIKNLHKTGRGGISQVDFKPPIPTVHQGEYVKRAESFRNSTDR